LRQHDIVGVTVKVVWISDAVTQCEAGVIPYGRGAAISYGREIRCRMNQDVDLHSRPLGQAMHVDNNRSMENAVCRWLIIRPVEGATGKGV
jgi:hypothetical protein